MNPSPLDPVLRLRQDLIDLNIVGLEDNMPDEFASTGNSSAHLMIIANSIALTMDQLNNESPNVQSTLVQSSIPNIFGVGINYMPMSIDNNGTQPMHVINRGNESEGGNGSEGGTASKAQPISGAPTAHLPRPLSVTELEPIHAEPQLLKRKQLFWVLHATDCTHKVMMYPHFRGLCPFDYCKTIKIVFRHMNYCKMDKECTVQLCYSTKQMIKHWSNCVRHNCPLCGPLTNKEGKRKTLLQWLG